MKKYQARKAISVLLAVLMVLTSVYAGLGVFAYAAEPEALGTDGVVTGNPTLASGKVYTVTQDTTISGNQSANGLTIPSNETVIIDIAAGITLTVNGGAANGTTAGKAGILMQTGSKLIFTGSGTLKVIAGKGGNGGKGDNNNGTTGGAGGAGGAGGGAAIGTNGGVTTWPTNATVTILCGFTDNTPANNDGSNGSAGTQGSGSSDGGAGGGGGKGQGGKGIGTGGGAGKAGGTGTNGSSGCSNSRGTTGGTGSAGTGASAYTYLTTDPFAAMQTAITNYADYYTKTMAELVALGNDALTNVKTAIETPYNSLFAGDGATYNKDIYSYYFSTYDTELLLTNIAAAIAMAANIALAQWLQAKTADEVDYNASYSVLNTLWSEFNAKYNAYLGLTEDTRTFLVDEGYIVPDDVKAKLDDYKYAMDVANLRENYYDLITGDVTTFSGYVDPAYNWVIDNNDAADTASAALVTLNSYADFLNGLDQRAVAIVFGDDYVADTIQPLIADIANRLYASEMRDRFAGYKSVYDTAFAPVNLEAPDNTLYNVLNSYDSWVTELNAYIAELRDFNSDFADKVFNDLDNVMQAKINSVYVTLGGRHTGNIDVAYNNYMTFVDQYGSTINTADDVSMQNYRALRQVFNNINSTQVEFLIGSANFKNAVGKTAYDAFKERYELVRNALIAFEYFDFSNGVSAYQFNLREPAEDITRVVHDYDQVRNLDYVVDADKREIAYDNVRKLLESDLVKDTLGLDLSVLDGLADTLRGAIFSDSFVNTLISMVYPIVIDNFAPVWATQLPETYGPISESGFNFTFDIRKNLCSLREALDMLGLYAMPNMLAARPELNAYPDIKAKLAAVTYDPVYDAAEGKVTVNPWNDPSLLDADGKLALAWGVHDKDSFIDALSAGLAGVAPILLALLSNKTTSKSVNIIADGKEIKDSDTQYLVVTVTVTLDPINLNMTFKANDGFNNALAPILNVLGAETIGDGNQMDTLRKLATGIATPLEEIINKLAEDPIEFLLKALPNLAFALEYDLIDPLLENLKETITYSATAHYTPSMCAEPGDRTAVEPTDISVDVGETLLGGLNLDFSTASGLVNSIIGLLNKEEETEPGTEPVDPGDGETTDEGGFDIASLLGALPVDDLFSHLAYWGDTVVWHNGYRSVSVYNGEAKAKLPYIESTPSEVFANLVNYLLDKISGDEELLDTLIDALGLPVDLNDKESLITKILTNVLDAPKDAVAAIVELMVPQTYDNYAELETPADSFTYNENEITPANIAYLKYANDWDKDTATAIATNVDELIPTIAGLLGSDISLNETLQDALNGVFTGENLTKVNNLIAGAVAGLAGGDDAGDGEEEAGGLDILGLLKDELGLDLAAFQEVPEDYNWGITDGDKAAFVNKLCGILDPLAPLLKLVAPGKDLSILDGIVNVKGYDVYPKSFGLIFDALGIPQITGYENKTASEELEMILNALLAWVDGLTAADNSMIKDVLELLPDLVYFIESNGLSVAIKNLIYPVQILIDTIYPIYPIDLMEFIGGLAGGDEGEEPTGIAAILANLDLDNLKMSTILPIVDNMLGTELVRSPLATYAIPALTIKHGDLDAADVLTILLCGVIEAFEAEILDGDNAGKTNGEVILARINNEKVTEIYTKIVPLVTGGESAIDESKITPINWTYMMGDDYEIQLADFEMPEYSNEAVINYLSTYEKNQWTAELAEYLNDNLDSIVKDVLKVAGQDENYLATLINGLINDKLYTADVVNAAGNAIYDLLGGLEDQLKDVIDAVLGTEIAGKTYTPVDSVSGKADFLAKMEGILAPFNRILGFVLFGQSYKFFNGTTREDLLTLNGGDAYNAALVPVLEALGVTMPTFDGTDTTGTKIHKILVAVTDRLDAIAADPINKILDLLPNVLYFLNADGIKAIINNAVLPFDDLVQVVTGDPIATLLAGVEVGGVALNDLNTTALLTLIEGAAGIQIPDAVKTAISTFYIGKAVYFKSANGKLAFKLAYDGDRKDMITILASVLIEVLAYEDNASILKGVSEEAYQVVLNILGKSDEEITVPMTVPEWLYPEAADTDQTFSAINTSTEFGSYGPLFTQEMAIYLADNLDDFVDNMIYLLGIPADALEGLGIHSSTDEYITSLKDLLNTVIGDTVYTPEIADLLLNLVEGKLVEKVNDLTINGVNMSDIVKNVLKTALKVDLDRYTNGTEFTKDGDGKYHVQPFEAGSKEGFLNALVQILDPVYPVLNWLLCEEDIHFFTDSAGDHAITLKGGQGYKYGIIPILETFDCTSLPTQAEVSATTDTASLVNTIATPLLSRIDKLLENPVDEIFELLPNVAYFINSKGLDACVRNMVNAINVVMKALQPLVGDVDLLGIDLSTLDMQYILNKITGMIGEDSDLTPLVVDALAELTTGKIVTSSSQSDLSPWYKMEYAGEASKADTITTLLRFALRWVGLNGDKLKEIVRDKIEMSDEGYAYIDKLIDIVAAYAGTNSGMDSLLHMLYYIFYGIHNGSASVANWQRDYNSRFEAIAEGQKAATKTDENLGKVAELLDWLFVTYGDGDSDDTGNVYHNYDDDDLGSPAAGKPKGFAPNGFIAFFQQIINWFKTIFNKLFGR